MKLQTTKKIVFFIFLISFGIINSQDKIFSGDPDKAFEKARTLAFNNQRKQAQDSLRFILTKYPDYLDIRSFLANTYSWDGNYKLAREEFKKVLDKDKNRKTDWIAAIKNELYAELPFKANELARKALLIFPEDVELLFERAKSEEKLSKPSDAFATIDEILTIDASNKKALEYQQSLLQLNRFNIIGLGYSSVIYDKNERAISHYSTLNYTRQTKYGTFIGKINYANRFETDNYQYEIDLYPRISNGFYAYASAGISNDAFFPEVRYGAELYKSLPKGLEASLGFRALKFGETTIIYTSSVSWYVGNSYWSLRGYLTPNDAGSSKSGTLIYRKYYSDSDNFFSVSFGLGVSPELQRLPVDQTQSIILALQSQKIGSEYFFTTKDKKSLFSVSFNVLREEKSLTKGEFFIIYQLGVSYGLRFK